MSDWPAGARVVLSGEGRLLDGGRVLLGGRPVRARRLSDAGRDLVLRWLAGEPVGERPAPRALAATLIEHGVLAAIPPPVQDLSELTIVVPARDRPQPLARCVRSLRASAPGARLIVVDDGSEHPPSIAGAEVIRHARPLGPAAARNTGLRASTTALVAFVDSDVVVPDDWCRRLAGHFADPRVAAVAPRIAALPPERGAVGGYESRRSASDMGAPVWGAVGGYESRHSALDMGPRGGAVGPGRPVPYVPSAALMVRREAAADGFDPALRLGEDVDFVWRLGAAGWAVRYAPDVAVFHDHRLRLREFARRRRAYAVSVATLAKRHPGALSAARLAMPTAMPWAYVLFGRPATGVGFAAANALELARRLQPVCDRPYATAAALTVRGLATGGAGLAHATRRAWALPLAAASTRSKRARVMLGAAFACAVLEDVIATRAVHPGDVPLRLVDELIALAGALEGCARERTLRPLLPG